MFSRSRMEQLTSDIVNGQFKIDEQQMTPDESVIWDIHRVDALRGSLLLPPDPRGEAVRQLTRFVLGSPDTLFCEKKRGSRSRVYFPGELAVKRFLVHDEYGGDISGLPGLQANIALEVGLTRVDHEPDWRFIAPKMLGAHLPEGKSAKPTWVMTREYGETPKFDNGANIVDSRGVVLLPLGTRLNVYDRAVQACGYPKGPLFDYDDRNEGNSMVKSYGDPGVGIPSDLVKLDIAARSNLTSWNTKLALTVA